MTQTIEVNGNFYNDGSTPPGNMANGGHRVNLLPMISDAMADIQRQAQGSSTTSLAIGTGSKSLTLVQEKPFAKGHPVMIVSDANPANFMFGIVTAKSGTSLTVNVTAIGGSGTFSDWNVVACGPQGPASIAVPVAIANGGTGETSAANAFNALKQAASDLATGVVELATQAEVDAGVDATRVLTPATAAGRYLPDIAGSVDATNLAAGAVTAAKAASGFQVDRAYATTATRTVATAAIPADNSKPQISEGGGGFQVTITPKSSTNRLRVTLNAYFSNNTGVTSVLVVALFRVGTNDAKKAISRQMAAAETTDITLIFEEAAGAVSAITYQINFGPGAAAGSGMAMNGGASDTLFGGADEACLIIDEFMAA